MLARQAALLRDESSFLDDLAGASWPPQGAFEEPPVAPLEQPIQRDERHHIEHAEPGMCSVVTHERGALGDCRCQRADGVARVARSGSGEGEDRPVVVGVGVHVQQRGPARLCERPQQIHVAAFRDVRDTLQHVLSVGAGL